MKSRSPRIFATEQRIMEGERWGSWRVSEFWGVGGIKLRLLVLQVKLWYFGRFRMESNSVLLIAAEASIENSLWIWWHQIQRLLREVTGERRKGEVMRRICLLKETSFVEQKTSRSCRCCRKMPRLAIVFKLVWLVSCSIFQMIFFDYAIKKEESHQSMFPGE